MEFSKQQIANWRKYEKVRASGRFNMFDPLAQSATRLNDDDYLFVIKHFAELKQAATGKEHDHHL